MTRTLVTSGLPLKSFGFYVQPVDGEAPVAFAELNAERAFVMASTTKLVTSLAALDLLGAAHRWRTQAFAAGPVSKGRLAGDLVISGGSAGLTPAELKRWFRQMRAEGLHDVAGNIVLEHMPLLYEAHPAQAAETAREASIQPIASRTGSLVVAVQPADGERAAVSLQPRPAGVLIVNDVFMGSGGNCNAWAQWRSPRETGNGPAQLWVRGSWDASCGGREIAYVRLPASARLATAVTLPTAPAPVAVSTPRMVSALWAETGGRLGGRIIETEQRLPRHDDAHMSVQGWTSQFTTPLPDVIREMNKTSNNIAARSLLLALSPPSPRSGTALRSAQDRVHAWLRGQGLVDGDIRIDLGSGQSHEERGKPRAMVQLLHNAWRASGAKAFVDSLPIAGVDGTLANRMRHGSATGQAYLKTGTLHDTRALAGYVRAKSGKVYALAAMVNDPRAERGTPALDAFIEWVAKNG